MRNKPELRNRWINAFAMLLVIASTAFATSTLTVEAQGDGYVDSYPSGILCGAACVESYSTGTVMTLTAHPNEGATFTKWGGCDSFSGTTCTVDLASDRTVVATFSGEVKSEYNLRVYRTGSPGVVRSDPFSIYCGSICVYDEAKFDVGSVVKVIATPNPGYNFIEWSGDCSGTSSICILTMDSGKTATATFGVGEDDTSSTPKLTIQKTGEGTGTVTSDDKKINCGTSCSTSYQQGTPVTLTATSSPGSTFKGWSGGCSGKKTTCSITLDSAKTAIAEFSTTVYTYGLRITTSKTPKGGGKVVSTDGKVNCENCNVQIPEGSNVTLTAISSSDFVIFDSWAGDFCNDIKEPTCTFTMPDITKSVHANFKALYIVSIENNGPGKGVVKSKDALIDCGVNCSTIQVEGTEIILEATPERRSIFSGWEGPCSSGGSRSKTCTVLFNADKKFIANFDHYMLPLIITKTGPGKISSEDNKINCGFTCNTKYILDSVVNLTQIPEPNSRFKGWGGKCSGLGTCSVTIEEMNNTVSAKFLPLYSLTVVNKYGGIAKTSSGISCGDSGSKSNTAKNCSLQELEGGTTVEILLEGGNSPQWDGCDSRIVDVCIIQMNRNKEVTISMSSAEEASLVKQALRNVFTQNQGVQSFVENENNPPFTKTLQDLQALKMGHNFQEVEGWIRDNSQWYIDQGGIQAVIDNWEKGIAKQVLLEVFASEVLQYPTLAAFLADESQKPFQSALSDLKFGRDGGGKDGLKSWISAPANRQWYYDATGIGAHIAEIEKQKLEAEIAAKKPIINSISPEGGKIGNPAKLVGRFYDVQLVTLNGNPVSFIPDSESLITLPNVKWGSDPEGVRINTPGNVKVITKWGEAESKLISPAQPVLLNGVGEKEECFPGVGMGCKGGGDIQGILASIGTQIGCPETKPDGQKICWISTGSIAHDNCCVQHPSGKKCGGPGTDGKPAGDNNHDGSCVSEWDQAIWDTFWRKAWKTNYFPGEEFDLTPSGTSRSNRYPGGEAVSSLEFCAPSGHEVREPEFAAYCCSGSANGKKCN